MECTYCEIKGNTIIITVRIEDLLCAGHYTKPFLIRAADNAHGSSLFQVLPFDDGTTQEAHLREKVPSSTS